MPNRSFIRADQQETKQEGINNGTNGRTITVSSRALCPLSHLGKSKCPLSLEICCPLPLLLGQPYKTQARSKCQQLIQVLFGFDLSGDPSNSSKVMVKWQKMSLEVCPLWFKVYELWFASSRHPELAAMSLHLIMSIWSRLELGSPLSQGSLGKGKPRQKRSSCTMGLRYC